MLVASTPETTNPVADQCEANQVPCISTVAPWQPYFFGRQKDPANPVPFEWTYHFFWGLEDVIAIYLDMWSQVDTNKQVGGIFPNDGDGNAWGDPNLGFPKPLAAAGYTINDPGRYENGSSDFSAQIGAFKTAKAEIITGVPIPPDFTTFWNQAKQQGFKPKVASIGKALLFPASVEALGTNGEGDALSSEVWWSPSHPFTSSLTGDTAKALADGYTAATSKQWTQPIGFAHALFELANDVLKRTTDIESKATIRDALKVDGTRHHRGQGGLGQRRSLPEHLQDAARGRAVEQGHHVPLRPDHRQQQGSSRDPGGREAPSHRRLSPSLGCRRRRGGTA